MLVRSLYLTFHSPNPRIQPKGWEGQKPASAGFLLTVFAVLNIFVAVCYKLVFNTHTHKGEKYEQNTLRDPSRTSHPG